MYIVDTNILIYHLHKDSSVEAFVNEIIEQTIPVYISAITETELLRWPQLTEQEETTIYTLLDGIFSVPIDSKIARHAGYVSREYNMKLADSIIAATALATGLILVTRNVRDFKKVEGLKLLEK